MRTQIFLSKLDKIDKFEASFPLKNWLQSIEGIEFDIQGPSEYYCPITLQIMTDPVFAADGYTYERSAIKQYFDQADGAPKSPMTNIALNSMELTSNYALRSAILEYTSKKHHELQKTILKYGQHISNANTPYDKARYLIQRGKIQYRRGLLNHTANDFKEAINILKTIISSELFAEGNDVEFHLNNLSLRKELLECEISLEIIKAKENPQIEEDYKFLLDQLNVIKSESQNITIEIDKKLKESIDSDSDSDNESEFQIFQKLSNENNLIRELVPVFHAMIGDLHFNQEKYQKCIGAYIVALSGQFVTLEAGFNATYQHQLGKAFSNTGNYKDAIQAMTKAIHRDGSCVQYYVDRGKVYYQSGDYSNAIVDFDFSLRFEKDNKSLKMEYLALNASANLAQATFKANSNSSDVEVMSLLNSSISYYTTAIKIGNLIGFKIPAKWYFDLGICFINLHILTEKKHPEQNFETEHLKNAKTNLNFAIENNPNEDSYYFARALASRLTGDTESAENDTIKAAKLKESLENYFSLANDKFILGKYFDAGIYYLASLNILESTPKERIVEKNYLGLLPYPNQIGGLSVLETIFNLKYTPEADQKVCINYLVKLYRHLFPTELATIFNSLYHSFIVEGKISESVVNKKIYNAMFSSLKEVIHEDYSKIKPDSNYNFSSMDQEIIDFADTLLNSEISSERKESNLKTAVTASNVFSNQSKALKYIAYFCFINKLDEPLINIINHIYKKTNLLNPDNQFLTDLTKFTSEYKKLTKIGFIEFIRERRQQDNQKIKEIEQLKIKLSEKEKEKKLENLLRKKAETRASDLEATIIDQSEQSVSSSIFSIFSEKSIPSAEGINIDIVFRSFLERINATACGWRSTCCSSDMTPVSVLKIKYELNNLDLCTTRELKEKIYNVYNIMRNAIDINEKSNQAILEKYKAYCQEAEKKFLYLLEHQQLKSPIIQ